MQQFFTTKRICRAAMIAALYAALAFALAPISYGEFQCRVSEALTVLPLFFPEAIAGLTIGCLIANLIGNGILDIVFGTLATLLAAITTYFIGKLIKNDILKLVLGLLPPILYNAIVVPFTFLALADLKEAYFISAFWVGLGQLAACGVGGTILYFAVLALRKKGATFFVDKENEKDKTDLVPSLLLTLAITLPSVGALFMAKLQWNVAFFVLLGVGIILLAAAIYLFIKNRKTEKSAQ